jgi:hypothetical protein
MFGIDVEQPLLIKRLEAIGITQLKELWKAIWTSWRIESEGVGVQPVNELLQYFFDFSLDLRELFSKLDKGTCVRMPLHALWLTN